MVCHYTWNSHSKYSISMGNSNSRHLNYSKLCTELHSPLGPHTVTVLLNHPDHSYASLVTTHSSLSNQKVTQRQGILHPNILRLLHYQQHHTLHQCTAEKTLQMFYSHIKSTLLMDMLKRKASQKAFTEDEITSLLLGIASALIQCEQRGVRPAHLTKESICMGKNGQWAILLKEDITEPNPCLLYRGAMNPDLFKKSFGLSPQILQSITQQQPRASSTSDDVFSLALTVLSVCLMKQIPFEEEIIQIDNSQRDMCYIFPFGKITDQVSRVRKTVSDLNYGVKVKQVMRGMLEEHQRNRLTPSQIIAALQDSPMPSTTLEKNESNQIESEFTTKPTQKIVRYYSQSKANLPKSTGKSRKPSIQDLCSNKCIEKTKKLIDVQVEPAILQTKTTKMIATNPKQYKISKVRPKILHQQARPVQSSLHLSRQLKKSTPIKQLCDGQWSDPTIQRPPENGSRMGIRAREVISRTSLALNLSSGNKG